MAEPEVQSNNPAEGTSFAAEIQEIAGLDEAKREERIAALIDESIAEKKSGKTEALAERVRLMLDLAKSSLTPEQLAVFRDSLNKAQDKKSEELRKSGEVGNIDATAQQYLPMEMSTNAKRATAGVAGVAVVLAAIKWGPKLAKKALKATWNAVTYPFRLLGRGIKKAGKYLLIGGAVAALGLGLAHFLGVDLKKWKDDLMASLKMGESIVEAEQKAKEALAKAKAAQAEAEKIGGKAKEEADELVKNAQQKVDELTAAAQAKTAEVKKKAQEIAPAAEEIAREQALALSVPGLLRVYGDDAEELGIDIFEKASQLQVRDVLLELHKKETTVKTLQECLAAGEEQGAAKLFEILFKEQTGLTETQRLEMTRHCRLILRIFAKHQDALKEKYKTLHGSMQGFEQQTFDEMMDLLGEGTESVVGDLAAIAPTLASQPWRHPEAIKEFLDKSFGSMKELGRGQWAEIMQDVDLSEADRAKIRFDVLSKAIGSLGDPLLAGAPGKIDANTELNDVERSLLKKTIERIAGLVPVTDPASPLGRALEGEDQCLKSLEGIWKEKLRLNDALQIFALERKASRNENALILLRLKVLHLLSKHDQQAYTTAAANFGTDISQTMLGLATGALSTAELPPGSERLVRMLGREVENKGDDWWDTLMGILNSRAALGVAGATYLLIPPVRRGVNWTLSRPMATYSWATRWKNINFINYKRGWLFFNTKPRPASEIAQKFRIPEIMAKDLQSLAEKYRSQQNARGFGRTMRGMRAYSQFTTEVAEMRFGWLSQETDAGKVAQVFGLVHADGSLDTDTGNKILQRVQQERRTSGAKNKAVSQKKQKKTMQEIDQMADARRSAMLAGNDLNAAVDPTPATEEDLDVDTDQAADADQTTDTKTNVPKQEATPTINTEAEQKLRTELETGLESVRLAQQETARLQQELQQKTAELDRKIEANGNADNTQIQELRRELDLARAELVVARDQATQNIETTEAARAKLESELGARIKTLEADLQKQKTNTEGATDSVNSVQESFEAMQDEIDSLKQEISDLQKASKQELDKATKALTDKVAALESSQQKAKQAQDALTQKTDALQKAQEKSGSDTKTLTDDLAKAREDLAKLQEDVIAKATAAEQARSEVEARLEAQVDVLAEQLDTAREATDAQGETVTKLQQDLTKATEQLAAQKKAAGEAALELDRRLSKMKGDLDLSIGVLQRESDAAKSKQAELTEALRLERETNGQNVTRIDGELKAATERAAALDQELKLAKEQQTELATQVEQVKKTQKDVQTVQQRGPRGDGEAGSVKTDPRGPKSAPDAAVELKSSKPVPPRKPIGRDARGSVTFEGSGKQAVELKGKGLTGTDTDASTEADANSKVRGKR